jgi:hypothetical protein
MFNCHSSKNNVFLGSDHIQYIVIIRRFDIIAASVGYCTVRNDIASQGAVISKRYYTLLARVQGSRGRGMKILSDIKKSYCDINDVI